MSVRYLRNGSQNVIIAIDNPRGGFDVYDMNPELRGIPLTYVDTTLSRYLYGEIRFRESALSISALPRNDDTAHARIRSLLNLKSQDVILYKVLLLSEANLCRWLTGDIQVAWDGPNLYWYSSNPEPMENAQVWLHMKKRKSVGDPALPHSTFWINDVRVFPLPWAAVSGSTAAAKKMDAAGKAVDASEISKNFVGLPANVSSTLLKIGVNKAGFSISSADAILNLADSKSAGGALAAFGKYILKACGTGYFTPAVGIEYLTCEKIGTEWQWAEKTMFIYVIPVTRPGQFGFPQNIDDEVWVGGDSAKVDEWKRDAIKAWGKRMRAHS